MLKMLGGFKISSSMMELDICKHIYLNTPHLGDLLVLSFFGFLIFLYLSVESNVSIAPPPLPWTDPAADVCTAAHGVVFSAASESRDMAKAVENSGFSAIYSLSFHTTLLLVHGFLVPAVFWPAKYLTGGTMKGFGVSSTEVTGALSPQDTNLTKHTKLGSFSFSRCLPKKLDTLRGKHFEVL